MVSRRVALRLPSEARSRGIDARETSGGGTLRPHQPTCRRLSHGYLLERTYNDRPKTLVRIEAGL